MDTSYVVAVHVVNAAGEIVAQHDSIPGGGLYPTTVWEVNAPVHDRFVITLPGDLARDRYTLRLIVYDPATGVREATEEGDSLTLGMMLLP
jgi:hypothetical protein